MLLLVLFLSKATFAHPPVVLNDTKNKYVLGSYLELLEDTETKWTLETIHSDEFHNKFTPSTRETSNFGFTQSAYWARLNLKNDFSVTKEWLLEIAYPLLDKIELYRLQPDGTFQVKTAGDQLKFLQREIPHRNFIFRIETLPKSQQTLYIRVETESSMQFPMILWSQEAFIEKVNSENYSLGIYYGIMLVMALYNLFIFFSLRDKNYLFYVVYIISYMISQMTLNGLAYEFLWPHFPWWANRSVPFFMGMSIFWILIFSMNFLQITKFLPSLRNLLVFFVGGGSVFVMAVSLLTNYRFSILSAVFVIIPSCIIGIFVGIRILQKGYKPARFYLVAWVTFISGILAASLKNIGLLPTIFLTEYGVQIGSAIEVTLLSLALADRINTLQEEKSRYANELTTKNRQLEQEIRVRKQTENDLQEYKDQLEDKVKQQTNDLKETNDELIIANKELKETQAQLIQTAKLASIGELATGVAHELNQPLTYMRMNAELETEDGPEKMNLQSAYASLKLVEEGTDRMKNIINHLRTFAREGPSEFMPVDLHKILENSFILLNEQLRVHNILVEKHYLPNLPQVWGNEFQLEQVFVNLLTNARDALSQKGGGTLTIKTQLFPQAETTDGVLIQIKDNGIGIPPSHMDKLFDPFFTTKEVDKGTGLGLSISYGIIKNHRGEIRVSSKEGESTTFEITLPVGGNTKI